MTSCIRIERKDQGLVHLWLDKPDSPANLMDRAFTDDLEAAVSQLLAEGYSGIVLRSAKQTFFAGGDLKMLSRVTDDNAAELFAMVERIKAALRRLETAGKPVVAAINGAALGGGWELCLACHHRVALDGKAVQLGLPEVTLGLLPGGGGVARTVRLLGLQGALPWLTEGKRFGPAQGVELGLIHALANSEDELIQKAEAFIRANPEVVQPWDQKGYKLPGGLPSSPALAQLLPIAPALIRAKTHGCLPAPEAILAAMVEGAQVDFDTAARIESRYFVALARGQVAKNLINTFWFQLNEVKAGRSRPSLPASDPISKVGILGAGMMGAGIAYGCALAGIQAVLKDVSVAAAEKGKGYSDQLLAKRVAQGRCTPESRDALLARIHATDASADLAGCQLVIEAVFENRELKARVTREAEAVLDDSALFASNTSTLPITGLAQASSRPGNFIGLHFFSPVDKMQLVEIIRGRDTDDATLARAYDFVQQIKKIPIVVNDSRGFFTSRVFGTFCNEGLAMVAEGVEPALIENAAWLAGFPVGPLAVSDEVTLTLMAKIRAQTIADLAAEGQAYPQHPGEAVVDWLLEQDRPGKAAGAGFYDYPTNGGKKALWPGLRQHYGQREMALDDCRDRLLYIMALETLRCLDQGVLDSSRDANIGSVFGIGFPAWTGGAVQFVNQCGLPAFVARARELEGRYGERFAPPALLLAKAEAGENFSG